MSPRRSFCIAAISALAVFCALAFVAFRGAGRWLVRQDPLASADEIVVLSGSMPARAEEAGRIFQMGYATDVWVSRPDSPRQELESEGIHYEGEEDLNRAVLLHAGIPAANIHIFPQPIINTEDEIREVSGWLQRDGETSAIIVTSPQHTRRVRALWTKLAGKDQRLIVRAAPGDPFDAGHWWRNTHDALAVVREVLGLLNVWLGLPVRPQS